MPPPAPPDAATALIASSAAGVSVPSCCSMKDALPPVVLTASSDFASIPPSVPPPPPVVTVAFIVVSPTLVLLSSSSDCNTAEATPVVQAPYTTALAAIEPAPASPAAAVVKATSRGSMMAGAAMAPATKPTLPLLSFAYSYDSLAFSAVLHRKLQEVWYFSMCSSSLSSSDRLRLLVLQRIIPSICTVNTTAIISPQFLHSVVLMILFEWPIS